MKKLYILLLLVVSGKTIFAQQYIPMLDSVNHWQNVTNFLPVRHGAPSTVMNAPCTYPLYYGAVLEEFTTQDTVINTLTYKIVCSVADLNPPTCILGYMREDTAARKVYFIDNMFNPEILLYDFSMVPGNTIPVSFTQNGYFTSGTFTLDSIRTIHIVSGFRRIFYLSNHALPSSPSLPWIESVGCPFNAFYPYSWNSSSVNQFLNCNDFQHESIEFMTCFDHMNKVYYDSCVYQYVVSNFCFFVQDTCNYYNVCGDINEISSISSFEIFPNPTAGKTTVMFNVARKGNFEILIWDISGKKLIKEMPLGMIAEGKKEITLDLEGLQNGIYFIQCKGESGSAFGKLLINH